jgi:hypothetical protein
MVGLSLTLPLWPWPAPSVGGKLIDATVAKTESDEERAFELADSVEKGLARENVCPFMKPLTRSNRLRRFNIIRSDDKLQYRLFAKDGGFIMYARMLLERRRVEFFMYDPRADLFDPARPAFTMQFSRDQMEWRLLREGCECSDLSPKRRACSCTGKQQVLFVRHHQTAEGDGVANGMEVHIPGMNSDGSQVVWCSSNGRGDLGDDDVGCGDEAMVQRFVARQPEWDGELGSLVLDFKGREIVSSAKNFQITLAQKKKHVVCQHGKIGDNRFGLDFKHPLSIVQAFGVSLTTLFWT